MRAPDPNPGVAHDLVPPQDRVADANHEYGLSGCLGGAGFRSARLVPRGQRGRVGHQRTNPSRFGILTAGRVLASITVSLGSTPSIDRIYAVSAYTSSLVSDCGAVIGIARRT